MNLRRTDFIHPLNITEISDMMKKSQEWREKILAFLYLPSNGNSKHPNIFDVTVFTSMKDYWVHIAKILHYYNYAFSRRFYPKQLMWTWLWIFLNIWLNFNHRLQMKSKLYADGSLLHFKWLKTVYSRNHKVQVLLDDFNCIWQL